MTSRLIVRCGGEALGMLAVGAVYLGLVDFGIKAAAIRIMLRQ